TVRTCNLPIPLRIRPRSSPFVGWEGCAMSISPQTVELPTPSVTYPASEGLTFPQEGGLTFGPEGLPLRFPAATPEGLASLFPAYLPNAEQIVWDTLNDAT